MIKTILAGETLARALDRHQDWVDRNGGEDDSFIVVDDWPVETRRPAADVKKRMAKAQLPPRVR